MPRATTPDPISDHVREFVDKGEQAFADARERWSESLRDLVPGDGARVRKIVDDVFDFTERLIRNQREFASSVLDAVLGEEEQKPASSSKRTNGSKGAAPTKRASKPKAAKQSSAA